MKEFLFVASTELLSISAVLIAFGYFLYSAGLLEI